MNVFGANFFNQRIYDIDENGFIPKKVHHSVVRGGRGRVTGYYDGFAVFFEEKFTDCQGVVPDGVGGFFAVRKVRGVTKIYDRLVWQSFRNSIGDRKAANT